ncbi:hypothetical protein BKA80DRAFT_93003 [Phyllosticta citrichinensis]
MDDCQSCRHLHFRVTNVSAWANGLRSAGAEIFRRMACTELEKTFLLRQSPSCPRHRGERTCHQPTMELTARNDRTRARPLSERRLRPLEGAEAQPTLTLAELLLACARSGREHQRAGDRRLFQGAAWCVSTILYRYPWFRAERGRGHGGWPEQRPGNILRERYAARAAGRMGGSCR